MSIFERLFGKKAPPASRMPSQMHSQMHSQNSSGGVSNTLHGSTRRELLRVVLRDTLNRHGIPSAWIGADVLTTTSPTGTRALHWRLVIKHWDPRLVTCAVAFQHALIKRLTSFDPLASEWLTGISWEFELEDESQCPALPHPGSWTAPAQEAVKAQAEPPKEAGIIEGPVHIAPEIPAPAKDIDAARADLDALLAIRDADFQQHANGAQTWARTEPAKL